MKLKRLDSILKNHHEDDIRKHWENHPESKIDPIIGKDGFYFDRVTGKVWNEQAGMAWIGKRNQFEYNLSLLFNRRLSPRERRAILELRRMGSCPAELLERLRLDDDTKMLRQIRLATFWHARRYE